MQDLDKAAMGKRIRQIRLAAGLRQWELARMLGTTQSAVHKYEHGVVPEPRRLIELARIGNTTIEWVLTGRHWENGSDARQRLSPELLRTASMLRDIGDGERATVDEALRILRDAVRALDEAAAAEGEGAGSPGAQTRDAWRLLELARRIQHSILHGLAEDARARLEPFDAARGRGEPEERRRSPRRA